MAPNPKISFTFPIRWLKGDERKYLKKNIINQARQNRSKVISENLTPFINLNSPAAYSVLLKTHAYQPVRVSLTQEELSGILEDVFPGARLVGFQKFFVQRESPSLLPVVEMQIFY